MADRITEKVVELSGGRKIKMLYPSIGEFQSADMEFSAAYTKALKGGLLPRASSEKLLYEQGLWTEKDQTELDDLADKGKLVFIDFKLAETEEKKNELKYQFMAIQNLIMEKSVAKESLFTNTAESKGEEAKTYALFWKCVINEDGSKIWNSFNDFVNDRVNDWTNEALRSFVMFIRGLDEKINAIDGILKEEVPKQEESKEEQEVKTEEKATEEVKV